MTKILIDRATAEQALHVATAAGYPVALIAALKAALAEPVQKPGNGGRTGWPPGLLQDDCRGLSKWLASRPDARQRLREALAEPVQEPLTIERLRDALVTSRIIPPAAVEDPDGYDDGVTLFRIEALHRRIT